MQAFLENGSTLAGIGEGDWSKKPGEHIWSLDYIIQISDGSKIRSVGEINLESLTYTGADYSVD